MTEQEALLNLGLQPISNRFLQPGSTERAKEFPIELRLQLGTGLVQLANPFPVEEVRPRYEWLTCFEPEDHLDALVEDIIDLPYIHKDSLFGGYSFKDDSTLARLKTKGYHRQWRISPEEDLGLDDPCQSIETYQAVFSQTKAKKICQTRGKLDLAIVRHVTEHAYDLPSFLQAVAALMNPDGYIVWEVPDCENALENGDCTTIWEEHIHYFTKHTFKKTLENEGFNIIYDRSVPYPLENSLIVITKGFKGRPQVNTQSTKELDIEYERAYAFADKINRRRTTVCSMLHDVKRNRGEIALFGAGHLSVAYMSIMGVTELIDFVIDDNPNKKGLLMPIGGVPIVGSEALYLKRPSLCLLGLNPQNQPSVIDRHSRYKEQGGTFASIFPGSALELEEVLKCGR